MSCGNASCGNATNAKRVWRCARCRAMNRDREYKCGECGKVRDVFDAFVAPASLEMERARAEARTLADLYETARFQAAGYDDIDFPSVRQ